MTGLMTQGHAASALGRLAPGGREAGGRFLGQPLRHAAVPGVARRRSHVARVNGPGGSGLNYATVSKETTVTPAMEAGLADSVRDMGLIVTRARKPGKRGPHRKRCPVNARPNPSCR